MKQLKILTAITNRESPTLNKYFADISKKQMVDQNEETRLANLITAGDKKALDDLVNANLRFVVSVAKQYQWSGEKLEDLISVGNEGLIKAAYKFDATKGFKFISYAVWWVRQTIMAYIDQNGKMIRIPVNKKAINIQIHKTADKLEQEFEREATIYEISEKLAEEGRVIDIDTLESVVRGFTKIRSLDVKIGESEDNCLLDIIKTDTLGDVNHVLVKKDLGKTLLKVMEKLNANERKIISDSFGLFGKEPKTLEEISLNLEIPISRVRFLRDRGIKNLKARGRHELKEYAIAQ